MTGTTTRNRTEFLRMLHNAADGKIDLIITKSVSRFARNTVDSLSAIRQLKAHGVECFFEKENIWTFDSKGELLLTIIMIQRRKPRPFARTAGVFCADYKQRNHHSNRCSGIINL